MTSRPLWRSDEKTASDRLQIIIAPIPQLDYENRRGEVCVIGDRTLQISSVLTYMISWWTERVLATKRTSTVALECRE